MCVCVCVCVTHACMHTQLLSCVFATPWAVAHLAPLSMGFPRQEYWSGVPFLPPGDLPDSGIKPMSPASPALSGGVESFTAAPPGKSIYLIYAIYIHILYIYT